MNWGNCDYKQLQRLRDSLATLQSMDMDHFCTEVSKELAARLLALVIPRTPVGQYPKSSGKKGGTLRRGWTSKPKRMLPAEAAAMMRKPTLRHCQSESPATPTSLRSSTLWNMPAMLSLATEHGAVTAGCRASISSPCPSRTLRGLRRA